MERGAKQVSQTANDRNVVYGGSGMAEKTHVDIKGISFARTTSKTTRSTLERVRARLYMDIHQILSYLFSSSACFVEWLLMGLPTKNQRNSVDLHF